MTTIVNPSNPIATSSAQTLVPQMIVSGVLFGIVHAGLSRLGFDPTHDKGTPLTSAMFFGLLPAVGLATQAIFKKAIFKIHLDVDARKETKQVKALNLIVSASAGFCTLPINTCVYNIFAAALNLKQWDCSTIFIHQFNGLYHSALFTGMGMMINTTTKTLLTAHGLSEEEIESKMRGIKLQNLSFRAPLQKSHKYKPSSKEHL